MGVLVDEMYVKEGLVLINSQEPLLDFWIWEMYYTTD